MYAKAILALCASALFAQSALGQCLGRIAAPVGLGRAGLGFDGFGYDGLGMEGVWPGRAGCGCIELTAAYGGGLPVSSASAAAPTGLAVTSENVYEGPVAVAGNLPFLGTVAMEGVFPTAGAGVISYGCGDGAVAITAEGPIGTAYAPATIAPAAIATAAIAPAAIAPAAIAPFGITSAMGPWGYNGLPARGCGCGAPYVY